MSVQAPRLPVSPAMLGAGVLAGLGTWGAFALLENAGQHIAVPILAAGLAALAVAFLQRERHMAAAAAAATAERDAFDGERGVVHALLEQLPIGVVVIEGETGTLVRANREARRLLDQPLATGSAVRAVALGSVCRADGSPADPLDLVTQALSTGVTVVDELHVGVRDGDHRPVAVAASAMPDGLSPRPLGLLVLSDLTARREAEAEISRTQRFEALGEIAAGMAHNLGNQLTGVVCYLELLQAATDLPLTAQHQVDEAMACADLAADQTRRLVVAAAKIEWDATVPPGSAAK